MKTTITLLFLTFSIVNGAPLSSDESQPLLQTGPPFVSNGIGDVKQDSIKSKLPNPFIKLHESLKRDQFYDEHQQVLMGFKDVVTEVDQLLAQTEEFRYPGDLLLLIEHFNKRSGKYFTLLNSLVASMERKSSLNGNIAKFATDLRLADQILSKLRSRMSEYSSNPGSNDALIELRSSLVNDGDSNLKEYEEKMNSVLNGIAKLAEV